MPFAFDRKRKHNKASKIHYGGQSTCDQCRERVSSSAGRIVEGATPGRGRWCCFTCIAKMAERSKPTFSRNSDL